MCRGGVVNLPHRKNDTRLFLSVIFMLGGLGGVLFAIIDFMGMPLGYDLTGVPWSPTIGVVVGSVLLTLANWMNPEGE